MSTILDNLSSFPLNCIYAYLTDDGGVYLQYSMGRSINQIADTVCLLRRGVHDCRGLQDAYNRGGLTLEVMVEYNELVEDIVARAECSLIMQELGLRDIRGLYSNCKYRVKKHVIANYDVIYGGRPLVYVTVKSQNPGAIVLGIFDNMIEADAWLLEAGYDDGPIRELKFSTNEMTAGYHKKYGYKLSKFR